MNWIFRRSCGAGIRAIWWDIVAAVKQQIPFGNDSKKSNGKSRFPSGMTARTARATAQGEWMIW
jgi:hypothetical protein